MDECIKWLNETREIFPKLNKKRISVKYKKMSRRKLGYVRTKIEQKFDFNPESLILGESRSIKKRRLKPSEFNIHINKNLQKIENPLVRKEIVQYIIIHELLHIEAEDLITLSKEFNKRKKKKIHVNNFEEAVFDKYNKLREINGLPKINKPEYLDSAINKILKAIE
ncbi:hypothetical protein HZA33_01910 [Candidatus Pacearchaeota archaeon]|nr:hypothetical protein [Candidatus Pacearchaeota archaeon]